MCEVLSVSVSFLFPFFLTHAAKPKERGERLPTTHPFALGNKYFSKSEQQTKTFWFDVSCWALISVNNYKNI